MREIKQSEITTIVFLINSLEKIEDDNLRSDLFRFLRNWEDQAFADLNGDAAVKPGRYQLERTWWHEWILWGAERRRVVQILDTATGHYLAIPDCTDWMFGDDPDHFDKEEYLRLRQTHKPLFLAVQPDFTLPTKKSSQPDPR